MELATTTDDELVGRVRAGDAEAFGVLARRHHGWLVRICRQHLHGDHHFAEDLAQESLVRLHAALVRDERPLAVRPWLSVVARNLCIDHLRRRTPEPMDELPDVATDDEDPFDVDPALAEAWGRLRPRQREVLHHRELTGLSYDEIATVMDASVSAIETLLFRARAALRREYQRAGGRMLGCGAFLLGLDRLARGHTAVPEAVAHVAACDACARAVRDMDQIAELLRLGATSPPPRASWVSRLLEHATTHVAHVSGLVEPVASIAMAAAVTLAPAAQGAAAAPPRPDVAPIGQLSPHRLATLRPVPAATTARPAPSAATPTPAVTPTSTWRWTWSEPHQDESPHPRPTWSPVLPWPTPSPGQGWPTPQPWRLPH